MSAPALSALEQLRVFQGDLEVGEAVSPQAVIAWAQGARGFCPRCADEPLYDAQGPGLSGRTRSRLLIGAARRRGVVTSVRQVHCEGCPAAEPVVQLGVLGLLSRLERGEAWCLRYARSQPGLHAQQQHPAVEGWLVAQVPRWSWSLEDWGAAVTRADVAAERVVAGLELRLPNRLGVVRWEPGRQAEVVEPGSFEGVRMRYLEAADAEVHGLLAVDLALAWGHLRSRQLGEALLRAPRVG